MKAPVDYAVEGHVAWMTLNRPERANALDDRTMIELIESLQRAEQDDAVRVVALTAAGTRHFCAGRDLGELGRASGQTTVSTGELRFGSTNIHEAVLDFPKPTVAVINGMAIGGGLELALACDIRLAAATAVFSLPEANLGTGANFASVLLPELIGRAAAFEMFYTGEKMSADWAWRCGLINRLVEPTELRAQADAFLAELATKSPVSLQRFKATANKSVGLPLSAGLRLNVHPNPYTHPSRLEGLRARREGRAPNW